MKVLGKMFWPAYMTTGMSNSSCWSGSNRYWEDVDPAELLDAELSMCAGVKQCLYYPEIVK